MTDTHISERYEFRNIKQNEAEEAAEIERICFPPNEACSKKHMKDRVAGIADLFLVAIDKENGKMAGFLNGLATDDEILKDEFFTDASLHNWYAGISKENGEGEEKRLSLPAWNRR